MAQTRDLTERECEGLLRTGVAGRVAVSTPTGPHIVPVNYTMLDDAIIIRTAPYSLLGTYGRDTTFAFEIDEFDRERGRAWSVQARGRVEPVTDHGELERIRQDAEPRPWAGGSRPLYLRLRWSELTGRQVGAHWDPLHEPRKAASV
jgi:nitroimidazol reductase NimA-like FMN-containing flavoprotein (pyridoxamine 5'-phosphate oxidase superfamily)